MVPAAMARGDSIEPETTRRPRLDVSSAGVCKQAASGTSGAGRENRIVERNRLSSAARQAKRDDTNHHRGKGTTDTRPEY